MLLLTLSSALNLVVGTLSGANIFWKVDSIRFAFAKTLLFFERMSHRGQNIIHVSLILMFLK